MGDCFGIVQFHGMQPFQCVREFPRSSNIFLEFRNSMYSASQGDLTVQLGQEWGNKSSRGRARLEGDGWGGITDGHKATSQQNPLKESPQNLARPVSTGEHHPPLMWRLDWLAMLRVRILRECKECGAPRNIEECMYKVGFVKILGTAKHV